MYSIVVILFIAVEDKRFPSHSFDDTFYLLYQAFEITVSWWYQYVLSWIIESDLIHLWVSRSDYSAQLGVLGALYNIDSFHPSMKESLLSKAISFAKNYIKISDKDIDIIMHCRKSLLSNNETAWTKKKKPQHHVWSNYGQLRRSGSLWAYRTFPPEQP